MGTDPEAKLISPARLEFEVEDTGIGIAPEDRQRIFEPFVQLEPGRATRDGTGLGLTLSRMFIELLGGEITIQSQVGKGSIFAFDIAVKLAKGSAVHTQEAHRQVIGLLPGQPPCRLLIVDDSAENRFVLRQLLEGVGFHVLEAAGGQEAVDLHKSGQPHLIWMDLRMPEMDGNEAARRIRETESGKRTPIIALTAGVMENEGAPSRSPVFDDWVYKPFREREIFDKLEKYLKVQFVYQPSMGSAEADKGPIKAALTPADLAVLPFEWLKQFSQTLRKGRSAELMDLIDRISRDHADLAGNLAELVRVHQFDRLIPLVREALKENANG
jgi:CheY-like chemotaxis protein